MPLTIPNLDDRKYQDLLSEALARIPVHNPEWTNFNKSDPGVTIVELFAFLTESLLYRANQIPERNRRKFLSLLGLPLQPAAAARGLVTFTNDRGPLQTFTLNADIEVRAGQIPFRTEAGLDVLPVEARAYIKRTLQIDDERLRDYYRSLYLSFQGTNPPQQLVLYQTTLLTSIGGAGIDLTTETVDGALWVALLLRQIDKPPEACMQQAREAIANKTVNIGLVPVIAVADAARRLAPGNVQVSDASSISIDIPSIPPGGGLPADRTANYRTLARAVVPVEPTVVQVNLPGAGELTLWNNLEPLEDGADQLPPTLEDSTTSARVITWLRLTWPKSGQPKLAWAGINAQFVGQRAHIANEILPDGNGTPDQQVSLARQPVLSGSVSLTITPPTGPPWEEVDDLSSAGPEVPVDDLRLPPGFRPNPGNPAQVFALDAEAGTIRFGDGFHGMRPAAGATIRADYDYSAGSGGNVADGTIKIAPSLPAGITVNNPVRTWGGADAETTEEGEKQIVSSLQHRERLVTAEDFETITNRTPGVEIGRVEVLPVYSPILPQDEAGNAAGAVTLMVIPKFDSVRPDAPVPDAMFIDAICDWLDPRRLVTTELFVRGPTYIPVWVSVGINVVASKSFPTVRDQVAATIRAFLAPLRAQAGSTNGDPFASLFADMPKGWPLRRAIVDIELMAVVSRVPGVSSVTKLYLAENTDPATSTIALQGLELPRLDGVSVSLDTAISLDEFRGSGQPSDRPTPPVGQPPPRIIPIPAIPDEC
jgi:Baseplate J-like protein